MRSGAAVRLFLALACGCAAAFAQADFGMNKVQYGHKKWYHIATRHFDVYFTANSAVIGQYAAGHLEAMHDTVSRLLGFPLRNKVPIILYSNPAEFQQTNIIPYLLPEGVGGFTEVFKNRVAIPFEGSYADFHHVLQHEMVHAFMFDRANTLGNRFSQSAQTAVPLWFGEGLAEYASLGWDLGSESFMLDAVLFGYVGNPAQEGLPGFLAYKGGQSFQYYLAQTFGPGFLRDWIGEVSKGKDFEKSFRDLARVSLRETGDIWLRELRAIYWPELNGRRYGKAVARQLTDHTLGNFNLNMQPVLSPDGSKIAFFSDREPTVGLYVMDVKTEKIGRSLTSAGAVRGHLSFYPFQSRISWSPDGKRLAFVSKTGDRDVISIVNASNGRSAGTIAPPGITGMLSPDWSPDGNRMVFNGIKDGFSDLFVWDMQKRTLARLTQDIAVDQNPVFSPSGSWIAFESDRDRPGLPQDTSRPFAALGDLAAFRDIYRISADGGAPIPVAGGPYNESAPAYGPSDSQLVFVSNRSGISNMYLATLAEGEWRSVPISNLTSTCYSPSWSRSGDLLAFTLFENQGFDIFLMRNPRGQVVTDSLPKTRFIRKMENPDLRFFSPLPVQNLSSYIQDKARSDSLRPRQEGKKDSAAPASALPPVLPRPDSARTAPPPDTVAGPSGTAPPDTAAGLPDSLARAGAVPDTAGVPESAGKAAPGSGADTLATERRRDRAEWLDTGRVSMGGPNPRLGPYAVKPYGPKWGLEVATADLGYNAFSRGVAGQTFLTLSDLLGNHRISFLLSSGGFSLRSTNILVNYDLLPYRTDFSVLAFNFGNYVPEDGFYYLDREYGGGLSARYPLSIFTRFQADVTAFSSSRGLYSDIRGEPLPDSVFPSEDLSFIRPSFAWVNDNAMYGIVGPVTGRRMQAGIAYVPPIFSDSISFLQYDTDLRQYWMFYKKYTVAARISAGASQAVGGHANPQVYLAGGDDLLPFVARTKPGNGPETLSEVVFSQLAVPVRGFRYYEFRGNRKFISNLEFRFPFVETFRIVWPLPITMRYLMGTLFLDYGGAWQGVGAENELDAALDNLGLGYGYGFRLNLGIFVLRYTRAHAYEGIGPGDGEFRSYWSLGAEF